jgi:hypothetical protein
MHVTELCVDGAVVLFSCGTPVAAWITGKGYIRTSKWWSVTTTRHINKWLDGEKATEVDQGVLENLLVRRDRDGR